MASGLPVVATEIAGIPEQIVDGENGYLISTGDPGSVRERLAELLADPALCERMGEQGLERAERLSAERMMRDLGGVYQGLLSE